MTKTEYKLYLEKMHQNICMLSELSFIDDDTERDVTVSWGWFKKELKKLSVEHIKTYQKYLESDDDTLLEESEISKWRKENDKKSNIG